MMTPDKTVKDLTERQLLEIIAPMCDSQGDDIRVGFGDDGAVTKLPFSEKSTLVMTADAMIEGTHFDLKWMPWDALAHKAMTSNLSDLAAMGALPHSLIITLGLSGNEKVESVVEFYQKIRAICDEYDCSLIGGDTVRSPIVIVSIAATGIHTGDTTIPLRSHAKIGQNLYVTGWPGESGAGLQLLNNKDFTLMQNETWAQRLIERHFKPTPRIKEAKAILEVCPDAAMIDISDGVWNESNLIAEASKCGIILEQGQFPISGSLIEYEKCVGEIGASFEAFLFGGEDYELLFTSNTLLEEIKESLKSAGIHTPVSQIGKVTEDDVAVQTADGSLKTPHNHTFQHFKI